MYISLSCCVTHLLRADCYMSCILSLLLGLPHSCVERAEFGPGDRLDRERDKGAHLSGVVLGVEESSAGSTR